jgi:hypothetical protein
MCSEKHAKQIAIEMKDASSFYLDPKYGKADKLPPVGLDDADVIQIIRKGFSDWLSGSDGGQWIIIRTCYPTAADWTKLHSGEEHTGRAIESVCVAQLSDNKRCLLLPGVARQDYLGNYEYGNNTYRPTVEARTIDCLKAKRPR